MSDDETLTNFLASCAPEETTTIDLTRGTGAMQHVLVVKEGDRTAVLNIVRTDSHLSVDVRGYFGEAPCNNRMIGWGPRGAANFVPGTYPLSTVVVGETNRPAGWYDEPAETEPVYYDPQPRGCRGD